MYSLTFMRCIPIMKQQLCYTCEAACNSINRECPSCGTSLAAGVKDTVNPMPLIAVVCALIVVFGIMIGAAT